MQTKRRETEDNNGEDDEDNDQMLKRTRADATSLVTTSSSSSSSSSAMVTSSSSSSSSSAVEAGRTSSLHAPTMCLTGHDGAIYSVAFSPSGKHLASSSFDRKIFLWEVGQMR